MGVGGGGGGRASRSSHFGLPGPPRAELEKRVHGKHRRRREGEKSGCPCSGTPALAGARSRNDGGDQVEDGKNAVVNELQDTPPGGKSAIDSDKVKDKPYEYCDKGRHGDKPYPAVSREELHRNADDNDQAQDDFDDLEDSGDGLEVLDVRANAVRAGSRGRLLSLVRRRHVSHLQAVVLNQSQDS